MQALFVALQQIKLLCLVRNFLAVRRKAIQEK